MRSFLLIITHINYLWFCNVHLNQFYIKYMVINNLNTKTAFHGVKMTLCILCINLLSVSYSKSQTLSGPTLGSSSLQEISIYSGGIIWYGGNYLLEKNISHTPSYWRVPGLDRLKPMPYNGKIAGHSDWMLMSTAFLAALPALNPQKQKIEWNYANLLAQNILITTNLTQTVKVLVQRQRPLTQHPNYVASGNNDDHYSFFSGHSSFTAAAATTAMLYAYRYDGGKWTKPVAWASVGLALTTGGMRIAAGKHYTSDVLTGFIIGTGISLLNARLHEKN